eukprot:1123941-Alexandrium_andersonii.AAC.1
MCIRDSTLLHVSANFSCRGNVPARPLLGHQQGVSTFVLAPTGRQHVCADRLLRRSTNISLPETRQHGRCLAHAV